jgi:catalase
MQLIGHFIEPGWPISHDRFLVGRCGKYAELPRERSTSVNFPHLPVNGAVRYGPPRPIGIHEENDGA